MRRLFSSCTTYNLLTCAFEKLTEPPQILNIFVSTVWSQSLIAGNGATARVSASKCTNPWYISREPRQVFLMLSRNFDNIVGEKDNSQKCLGYEIKSWKHVSNVLASDFWKCQVLLSQATTAQVIPRQTWRNGSSCSATLQRRCEWVQNLASSTHYATMQSKYTTSDSQHGKDMYIGQAVLLSAICVSRIKGKRLEPSCPLGPTGRRAESNHVWLLRSPNKCVQCEWKTSL